MAFCAALPVEGFQKQAAGVPWKAKRRGRREHNCPNQSENENEMIDELCAYIASEGGELRADRIAQFYQSKPVTYKQYFMREGLRNIVNRSGRLTWDPRDFIKLTTDATVLQGNTLTMKAASEGVQNKGSQLIHAGAYCVVRKHSTMGCAVAGFGSEKLVGCILGRAPYLQIMNTRVNISPHVDTNTGTGFAACSLFAAWGPDAENIDPISAQLLGSTLDAIVLNFLSSSLASHMSNPDLACVRSLVHYIAASFPAKRAMSVSGVEDFARHNPEYQRILRRRVKSLCDYYPQWLIWAQPSPKQCILYLGQEAIVAEFGEKGVDNSSGSYCGDEPFRRPCLMVCESI
mmetsp:Transcript_31751/g.72462  ORF Transcript_31751/g.72462 Transcript_31751/m.72462 type:complete len:346 (-) Transcript_31751:256-1293(-)